MKRHKSLSNILVILCGQGLCWPLWASMLFASVTGIQSVFHQGKSLSCDNASVHLPFHWPCSSTLYVVVYPVVFSRTRVRLWSCERPLPLSVRPLYSALMWVDDSVPMWGPVTVTRMREPSAKQCSGAFVGQGSRLIWGGAPSRFVPSVQSSGKLLWSQGEKKQTRV